MFLEASLVEGIGAPPPQTSLEVHGARRPLDRLVLSSYVEQMEWARLMEDAQALDQETARALINY